MAKQLLNTGTQPNDGSGDGLRTGGTKINNNFKNKFVYANFMVSPTKEDYLRHICKLERKLGRNVKPIELARYMKLAKSTVSERLDDLSKKGLISRKKYDIVTVSTS